MAFKLSIEQGKGQGQAFDFDAEQVTIGRTEENDVVLYEQGVSRRHARIERQDGAYYLEDMDSANGTLLNGTKVKRESLNEGDTIGIGAVVFRFGQAAKTTESKKVEGSTRIVAVPKDDRPSRPPVESPRPPTALRPSAAQPVFNPKAVGAFVALSLIIAILWAAYKGNWGPANAGIKCPSGPIQIDEVGSMVFGTVSNAFCRVDGDLEFGFIGQAKTRYLFYYTPFYTDKGEIKVLLNGKEVDESPLASTRRTPRREVVFLESDIKTGTKTADINVITFRTTKKKEWGIERIELIPVPLDSASAEKGEQAFQAGERLYEQRNVAASNLYEAYEEMRNSRVLMEGLKDPKPPDYAVLKERTETIYEEMNRVCDGRLFYATRMAKYGKFEAATEAYKYIEAAFPGDLHPCRGEAQSHLGGPRRAPSKS